MLPADALLTDQAALVTGAAQGIGKGIALGLASFGADVAIADRNADGARQTAEQIAQQTGRKAIVIHADVREEEQVHRMVREAIQGLGRLDILVNNAGGTFFAPIMQVNRKGWDMMLNLNLTSMFLATQDAMRYWMEHQIPGRVINVSSTEGVKACPGAAAYTAAKAAMINLTKTMATEFGPYGVRVNCIAPDYTPTEGTLEMRGRPSPRDEAHDLAVESNIPLRRQGTPDDNAGAVIFFASELSRWVTGQTLLVDGGAWWAARVEGAFPVMPQEAASR